MSRCGVVSGERRRGVQRGRRCGVGGWIGRGVGGGLVGRKRGRVGGRGRVVLGRGGALAMLGRGVLEEIGDVHGRVLEDERAGDEEHKDGGRRENQNSKRKLRFKLDSDRDPSTCHNGIEI